MCVFVSVLRVCFLSLLLKFYLYCFDMHKIVLNSYSSSLHARSVFLVCVCVSVALGGSLAELCVSFVSLCWCVLLRFLLAFVKPKSPFG